MNSLEIEKSEIKLKLLCYPRILGYVFNPLSIFFVYNKNSSLIAILYEVKNTFGEQHTYVFKVDANEQLIKNIKPVLKLAINCSLNLTFCFVIYKKSEMIFANFVFVLFVFFVIFCIFLKIPGYLSKTVSVPQTPLVAIVAVI